MATLHRSMLVASQQLDAHVFHSDIPTHVLICAATHPSSRRRLSTISLCPQVRYQGRAQLAFHGFERPSVIGAELLLFDDDCFGLMWHGPVQSLSLYVRVRQP
jgi:hypothetical protein